MGAPSKRRAAGGDPQLLSRGNAKPTQAKKTEKMSRSEPVRDKAMKQKSSTATQDGISDENDPRYGTVPGNNRSQNQVPNRRKILDTSLLARGMTARSISIRIANSLKPLAPSEIEKDIRHMEAYGAACISYAQQLFAFSNRELVARGHYGPVPPAPGMVFTQTGGKGQNGNAQPVVTMPVRIDPEEEKRLAILRKRVAASEAKREVLETEYLSLRAHYVHESHKLRRTRSAVTGQLKFLRELLKRRGQVLALRRVKCAVAKDILACLEYRATAAPFVAAAAVVDHQNVQEVSGVDNSVEVEGETSGIQGTLPVVPTDLAALWDLIESQLHDAELACTEIETPEELQFIKAALHADASALEAANEAAVVEKNRRSRSPMRLKEGEEEEIVEKEINKKKKPRIERSARRMSETGFMTLGKNTEMDSDDNVIPWNCNSLPRTPYGVALFLSNLSSSPDLAAAYTCDSLFGSTPQSLVWLEKNLPSHASPGADQEFQKLKEIKEEIKILQEELNNEVSANSSLQKEAIEGRRKGDQICSMMTMVRSETEAVVLRHNQILEAIETLEERKAHFAADSLAREEEYDDDNEDGTVVADDEGQDGFGAITNKFGGNYDASDDDDYDDDDVQQQPIKEVIVPAQNGAAIPVSIKRGFSGSDDNSDPGKKRRKVQSS